MQPSIWRVSVEGISPNGISTQWINLLFDRYRIFIVIFWPNLPDTGWPSLKLLGGLILTKLTALSLGEQCCIRAI